MLAAGDGHIEIVQMLVDRQADVNARNERGQTAVMLALQ